MILEVKMPQEGMSMTSGDIGEWLVKEGDQVAAGDVLAEVEAGKACFQVNSPYAGTVREICVQEGDTAMVGDVILKLEA